MASTLEAEVDRNFDAFQACLSDVIGSHRGQWALLRGGEIAGFFSDESQALYSGRARYADGLYSIQQVTDRPVDLGFFSHAINTRIA